MNTSITTIAEINGEIIENSFEAQSCIIDKTTKSISIKSNRTDELYQHVSSMGVRAFHTQTPFQTNISVDGSTSIISGCRMSYVDYGDCDGCGVLEIQISYQ
jgi:sensor histidine kinase regulating citrate/malate metabolism